MIIILIINKGIFMEVNNTQQPCFPVIQIGEKELPSELFQEILHLCNPLDVRLRVNLVNKQWNNIALQYYTNLQTQEKLKKTTEFAKQEFTHIFEITQSQEQTEWSDFIQKKTTLTQEREKELKSYFCQRSDILDHYPGWAHMAVLRHPEFCKIETSEAIKLLQSGEKNYLIRPSNSFSNTCTISYKKDTHILHQRVSLDDANRKFIISVDKQVYTFQNLEEVLTNLGIK